MNTVRTRIAPSPTGFFHIGNAKTALYNWLLARKTGGAFILRLEDTDVERSKEEYGNVVAQALTWLGLDWDEGPGFNGEPDKGDYGPYRQSQRKDLYRQEAQRLLDEGKAYKCFCSKEDLEAERERTLAAGGQPHYSGKCRGLTPDEIAAKGDAPYAVRFKVAQGVTEIDDIIQGVVRVDNAQFDDFIILRPNGDPVFHLSVVVDDGLMKVTHVIRGDDHLTNAARHIMLFNALGYALPKFVHHPLVHDEQGQKYSKRRHGANVLDWRQDGYLPDALINYLALQGWAPGDDREVFARKDLIEAFTVERLSLSAARFDLKKLQWLNGQHIRMLSPEQLRDYVVPILEKAGVDVTAKPAPWLTQMAAICQEKIATLNDIIAFTDFFFAAPTEYDEKGAKKQWTKPDALERMTAILALMEDLGEWTHDALKDAYHDLAGQKGVGLGKLIHPTRLALTGKSVGPGLFELAELLGRDECICRMRSGVEYVQNLAGNS